MALIEKSNSTGKQPVLWKCRLVNDEFEFVTKTCVMCECDTKKMETTDQKMEGPRVIVKSISGRDLNKDTDAVSYLDLDKDAVSCLDLDKDTDAHSTRVGRQKYQRTLKHPLTPVYSLEKGTDAHSTRVGQQKHQRTLKHPLTPVYSLEKGIEHDRGAEKDTMVSSHRYRMKSPIFKICVETLKKQQHAEAEVKVSRRVERCVVEVFDAPASELGRNSRSIYNDEHGLVRNNGLNQVTCSVHGRERINSVIGEKNNVPARDRPIHVIRISTTKACASTFNRPAVEFNASVSNVMNAPVSDIVELDSEGIKEVDPLAGVIVDVGILDSREVIPPVDVIEDVSIVDSMEVVYPEVVLEDNSVDDVFVLKSTNAKCNEIHISADPISVEQEGTRPISPLIDIETFHSSGSSSPYLDIEILSSSDSDASSTVDIDGNLQETVSSSGGVDPFNQSLKEKNVSDVTKQVTTIPRITEKSAETEFNVELFPILKTLESLPTSNQCPLCFEAQCSEGHLLWHCFIKNAESTNIGNIWKFLHDVACNPQFPKVSFGNLVEMLRKTIPQTDALYCMLCRENYEIHFDSKKLMKIIAISTKPTCVECNKSFCDRGSLKIHTKRHLGPRPYGCCCCSEVFDDAAEVKQHMIVHTFHSYGKQYPCNFCSKICFSERDHEMHVLDHVMCSRKITISEDTSSRYPSNSVFEIVNDDVSKTFNEGGVVEGPVEYDDDLSEDTEISVGGDACSAAEYSDTGVEILNDIQATDNSIDRFFSTEFLSNLEVKHKLPQCESAVEVMEEISKYEKREGFVCGERDLIKDELGALQSIISDLSQTVKESDLLKENRSPFPSSPGITQSIEDMDDQLAVFSKVLSSSYGSILGNLDKVKHWCNFCGSSFSHLDELRMHKDQYHEIHKMFACENCPANFGSVGSLFQHRSMHSPGKVHQCQVCFENFEFRFDIIQHLKVHFADRLKQCPECGHHYKLQHQLTNHLETHPELKPFLMKCQECFKVFTGSLALTDHNQRAHEVEKPHKCYVCGQKFYKQSTWLVHLKSHMKNRYRKSLVGMDLYKPPKRLRKQY